MFGFVCLYIVFVVVGFPMDIGVLLLWFYLSGCLVGLLWFILFIRIGLVLIFRIVLLFTSVCFDEFVVFDCCGLGVGVEVGFFLGCIWVAAWWLVLNLIVSVINLAVCFECDVVYVDLGFCVLCVRWMVIL